MTPPRILLVNYSSRRVAGTETYLEDLIAEMNLRNVPVALLSESDEPAGRSAIACTEGIALMNTLKEAEAWSPDVVMVNGRIRADWEEELTASYPSVYFIHNYYGTCISGLKRFWAPRPEPCERILGLSCLALYLPRSCGGKNPLTMIRLYGRERGHQERLKSYRMFVTHSECMKDEYLRHGFPAERLHVIPFACVPKEKLAKLEEAVGEVAGWSQGPVRLLFAGRMEQSKGGIELIRAAARLSTLLNRKVILTMAGEGSDKTRWEAQAKMVSRQSAGLSVAFPGWMDAPQLESAYRHHHIFAMPSLWPEPFGKGGMEAACNGCPSVGYNMGGLPQWLKEGVNGHLADWQGDPSEELAKALFRSFKDLNHYMQLRRGARLQAENFTSQAHTDSLLPLLAQAAREGAKA